jgi:hypothetical protein
MPIDTLQPVREAAAELPPDWLDHATLPPNTPAGLRYSRQWWDTPLETRQSLVAQAQTPDEFFVLWMWELEPALRVDIVKALGRSSELASTNVVLKTIYFEEPPEVGQAVRREARQILERRKEEEDGRGSPMKGVAIRTRGAVRTRGVSRLSDSASQRPSVDRSARAILVEIEDLEAANPEFKPPVRTR